MDVVVVGSGIVGASCAWHLASRNLSVAVLEQDVAPAMGSTGKSAAGVRVQFTTQANIELSMYSLPVYRGFTEQYGYDIGYQDIGYLLLVPDDRWDQHMESVALQKSMEAPTNAWVTMGKALGVEYYFKTPVTEIKRRGQSWVIRGGDKTFHCGHVVNATGAWSAQVSKLANLEVPVGPKRIQIFLSAPIEDSRTYPLTIDLATGVYLRSEGDRVLFGLDNLDQDFGFSEGMDWDWMEHVLLTGVDRFPWWSELGIDRKGSWWGYYAVSPDNSPVIGINPADPNWVDACGFSGHGIGKRLMLLIEALFAAIRCSSLTCWGLSFMIIEVM